MGNRFVFVFSRLRQRDEPQYSNRSSHKLQVTITGALISTPGTANVTLMTRSGTAGKLGCTSGGTSPVVVLTIT